MLKELIKIANELDSRGLLKEADLVDKIAAGPFGPRLLEPDFNDSPDPLGRYGEMKLVDVAAELTRGRHSGAWGNVFSAEDLFLAKPYNSPRSGGPFGRDDDKGLPGLDTEASLASQWDALDDYGSAGALIKRQVEEAVGEASSASALPPEAPMARAMGNSDVEKIQTLVGAMPDGIWGRKTRAKVKDFLADRDEYILPPGSSAEEVLERGQSSFSVRGSDTRAYASNWSGLLSYLQDLDQQRGRMLASLDEMANIGRAQTADVTEIDFEKPDPESGVLAGPRTIRP